MMAPSPSKIQATADDTGMKSDTASSDQLLDDQSSLLPPITATVIDDEASMDIAFIPMEHFLGDPATSPPTDHHSEQPAAFEHSIVSGTTDLFEGDLGDDELPSIMMHTTTANAYENLQLNPDELVEEVQAEVQQEAAADSANSALSSSSSVVPSMCDSRRPVVPFAVVHKLSDAQIVNEKCGSPPVASKRTDTKKTTPTVKVDAGRITRSRAKREAPPVAAEEVPSASPKTKKAKKEKALPPAMEEVIAPQVVASEAPAGTEKPLPEPTTKPTAASKVKATVVVSDGQEAEGATTKTLPVVTPMGTDESVEERQRQMVSKLQSPETPRLPTLGKPKSEPESKKSAASPKRPSRRASAKTSPTTPTVTVDTSTAHIKALTGENGASVCLSVRNCTLIHQEDTNKPDAPASTTISTTTTTTPQDGPLTEEQRAQQSRDRNRKHARNTRLRKKAYVEELKLTLNELVSQRDQATAEQQQNEQREKEQREVRFRVIEELLRLRGQNLSDTNRWSAILTPEFYLTLPLTHFQTMVVSPPAQDAKEQTLEGVEQVMQDSCHFAAFLQTLGKASNGTNLYVQYQCDRNDFMMDGCKAVLAFNAKSVGAVDNGASRELSFRGTLCAHFCPESNRLRSTEMIFDTGIIVDQINAMLA